MNIILTVIVMILLVALIGLLYGITQPMDYDDTYGVVKNLLIWSVGMWLVLVALVYIIKFWVS